MHSEGEYVRAHVGSGSPSEIQECYRSMAALVLEHKFSKVMIVGLGEDDPHSHLAARDVVIALHVIGVPAGFKIAFVPKTDVTRNGYRHAEIEARKRGLRSRIFEDEAEAVAWLTAPELH